MKLTELEPQFLKIESPGHYQHVDSVAEADGIIFLCPKCFAANGGRVGTHSVVCWRPRVPQSEFPRPGRWEFEGTGLNDLTLRASSSSILLTGDGCLPRLPDGKFSPGWHGFVTNGDATSC